jgi:hypothetical protein
MILLNDIIKKTNYRNIYQILLYLIEKKHQIRVLGADYLQDYLQ